MWKSITPQLPVADVAEAQRYYRDVLGFQIAWIQGDRFGAVHSGSSELFLSRHEGPRPPATCCVRIDDADGLYLIYRERGAEIVEAVATKPWGMREFAIRDPNGHVFRLGQSTRR
jgi:uncharacterized glyoxalase superfamily protein PhnB